MIRRIQPQGEAMDVQLSPGEALEVVLPAQTGGGYQWTVEPFTAGVADEAGTSYAAPSGAIGGNQLQSLWFRAKARGELDIVLRYGRAWEGEAGVKRRCRLRLCVR